VLYKAQPNASGQRWPHSLTECFKLVFVYSPCFAAQSGTTVAPLDGRVMITDVGVRMVVTRMRLALAHCLLTIAT